MAIRDFDYTSPTGTRHPALEEWLEDIQPVVMGLALRLPPEVVLDFSRQSLVDLNAWVLARFPDKRSVQATDDATQDLRVRISAYLGETLLLAAGGRWAYEDDPKALFAGRLVIWPDDGTGIPTAPLSMLTASVARRDPAFFTHLYDVFRRRVAERRLAEPGWRPVREPSPGLTVVPEPVTPEHEAWLAAMDDELARFIAGLPAGTWDLSPGSLDPLALVLLEQPAGGDDDGAVRYVGEVLRRAHGGAWETLSHPQDPRWRHQLVVDGEAERVSSQPAAAIDGVREKQDPSWLRRSLETYGRGVAGLEADRHRWDVPGR